MASVVSRSRSEKRKPNRKSPSSRLDGALDEVWSCRGELEARVATLQAVSDCIEECCSRLGDLTRLDLSDADLKTVQKAFSSLIVLE